MDGDVLGHGGGVVQGDDGGVVHIFGHHGGVVHIFGLGNSVVDVVVHGDGVVDVFGDGVARGRAVHHAQLQGHRAVASVGGGEVAVVGAGFLAAEAVQFVGRALGYLGVEGEVVARFDKQRDVHYAVVVGQVQGVGVDARLLHVLAAHQQRVAVADVHQGVGSHVGAGGRRDVAHLRPVSLIRSRRVLVGIQAAAGHDEAEGIPLLGGERHRVVGGEPVEEFGGCRRAQEDGVEHLADGEHLFPERFDTAAQCNLLQVGAPSHGVVVYGGHAVGDGQFGQCLAVGESVVAHCFQVCWQVQRVERGAIIERIAIYFCNAFGNRHIFQPRTIV